MRGADHDDDLMWLHMQDESLVPALPAVRWTPQTWAAYVRHREGLGCDRAECDLCNATP